jgi:fructose 1,6-bisphosphate aldolase/phosphatase
MLCALDDAHPARFDGPPRVVRMGFQFADGKLVDQRDVFGDVSFGPRAGAGAGDGRLPAPQRLVRAWPAADGGHGVHDDARVAERMHDRWEPIEEPALSPAHR